MREHLFKGKRTDNGEWVKGYYWINKVGNHFIEVVRDFDDIFVSNPSKNDFEVDPETVCECVGQPDKNNKLIFEFEVDPETLCEFTGLKDKNGKKIWENDIVKWITTEKIIDAICIYKFGGFCYKVLTELEEPKPRPFPAFVIDENKIEVIGNNFDKKKEKR